MKSFIIIPLFLIFSFSAQAQTTVESQADTNLIFRLEEFSVKARWKNDTERYRYNQLKYYVTTVLPYVNATSALFNDVNSKMEDPNLSRRDYKRYIHSREHEMREKFEDKVKDLNTTQGSLLIKLIARQTNLNIYKMITELKNPFAAMKWQAWARLNGMNLDRKYHPEDEPTLELIMEDLGYPLPNAYASTLNGK